jgi:hypothetical protein
MRTLIAALFALAVAAGHAPSDDKPKAAAKAGPDKTTGSELMKKKLEHAKKMLEGLAVNDFDLIAKSSAELMLISQKAEFVAAQKTREYELQTNDFRRALETVTKKAKDKNLDGATLGYVDMTLACIRCHQTSREVKIGLLPVPAERAIAGR